MYRLPICVFGVALYGACSAKLSSDHLGVPAKAASILQTQHQVARQSCNESEVLCPGSFYSIFPWDYSCASVLVGCSVACSNGEHICTTPPLCESCAAVNYCSAQPCPIVCGYNELLCDTPESGDVLEPYCATKEAGCPVHCADVDFQCHTPGSCKGCTALNWCSSAPCPATCQEHEVSCAGPSGSYCVPFSEGCPASCKSDEYECHRPAVLAGEAGVNFCSTAPCAPGCNSTEVACGGDDGVEFCVHKELGCPVHCTKSMYECHAPPKCENCTGLNWCSEVPCPELCSEGLISCARGNGSNFCMNRTLGCPADCGEKEHSCHWPPLAPNHQGMNWCANEACPEVCDTSQLACIKEDGSGFCKEKEEGCPVKCQDGEFSCHAPPRHKGGYGTNWCSTAPCQPNCTQEEVACADADHVYTCHKRADGCPVDCSQHKHACYSAPSCDDCVGVHWCSEDPCPTACSEDEIACPDEAHSHSPFHCRPKKDGCPVACENHEHKCFTPPACEGCLGMHWCSKEACPLICNPTEMGCLAENGTEFCVAIAEGCPVTCRDEEYVCHLAPQCSDCVGTNWCSQTVCAVTMAGR